MDEYDSIGLNRVTLPFRIFATSDPRKKLRPDLKLQRNSTLDRVFGQEIWTSFRVAKLWELICRLLRN